jgi:hypothetical protein
MFKAVNPRFFQSRNIQQALARILCTLLCMYMSLCHFLSISASVSDFFVSEMFPYKMNGRSQLDIFFSSAFQLELLKVQEQQIEMFRAYTHNARLSTFVSSEPLVALLDEPMRCSNSTMFSRLLFEN